MASGVPASGVPASGVPAVRCTGVQRSANRHPAAGTPLHVAGVRGARIAIVATPKAGAGGPCRPARSFPLRAGDAARRRRCPTRSRRGRVGNRLVTPAVLANVPAGQSLQLPPPGALVKCPAVQAVQAASPAADEVPDGHDVQGAALSLAWVPRRRWKQLLPGAGALCCPRHASGAAGRGLGRVGPEVAKQTGDVFLIGPIRFPPAHNHAHTGVAHAGEGPGPALRATCVGVDVQAVVKFAPPADRWCRVTHVLLPFRQSAPRAAGALAGARSVAGGTPGIAGGTQMI